MSAGKISAASFTLSLRYCKDIVNFFEYFEHPWLCTRKVVLSPCRKHLCLSTSKKSTLPPMFFWRYHKDMQTYYGLMGHARLHTRKMLISTWRTLPCLSTCQKQTPSLTSFLRYYFFKNRCNLNTWQQFGPTRHPEFCQICDWWWKISHNISFHLRLFPKKGKEKVFSKKSKSTILGPFLTLFAQNWTFWKKELCQFLYIPIIYHRAKNYEKLSDSWEKCQTDGRRFYRKI